MESLINEFQQTLDSNILEFWIEKMRDPNGGFYGEMRADGTIDTAAERGSILCARILWSFSAAYRTGGKSEHLEAAKWAKEYLLEKFYDREFGGIYWSLSANGTPLNTKKQFYAIGFAIYGLSEYSRATGDSESLEYAKELYRTIEKYAYDTQSGGYIEARTREWGEIEDMRLSERDENYPLSMNTHLHIIEPYTNLYRVWRDEELRTSIDRLIAIFTDRIYNPESGHLSLFFDMDWMRSSNTISYGHDIEASWLIYEAAMVIDHPELEGRIKDITRRIGDVSIQGIVEDGSMVSELEQSGHLDTDRVWWTQAEAVVGLLWLWHFHGGEQRYYDLAIKCWNYTKENIIDHSGGEWWWSRDINGNTKVSEPKAGFWKCPYHNSRMCLEAIDILEKHL